MANLTGNVVGVNGNMVTVEIDGEPVLLGVDVVPRM